MGLIRHNTLADYFWQITFLIVIDFSAELS